MIWLYKDNSVLELSPQERETQDNHWGSHLSPPETCQFCRTPMANLKHKEPVQGYYESELCVCQSCGWWVITFHAGYVPGYEGFHTVRRAAGLLRVLDVTDISVPTKELTKYLVAKYEERKHVHPRKYEDVVAGVFSDFGYETRVTSYSHDEGIDVFVFDGKQNDTIGVQVKRYEGKIQVEQVRAFAGALLLNGLTSGIFVTTSDFTKGSRDTATRYGDCGIRIDLWDATKFYDHLAISQRLHFTTIDDPTAPYYALWKNPDLLPTVVTKAW